MGVLREFAEFLLPSLSLSAAIAPAGTEDLKKAVKQFQEERANDIAALADRAGRSGVRLAIMEREREAWKAYARDLERICMRHGLEVPPAPDENDRGAAPGATLSTPSPE